MLRALTLILLCQLAGELAADLFRLPVPGPVIGMALLFLGLRWRGEVPDDVGRASDGLLANLSLLFVPAGVGVMSLGAVIEQAAAPIAAAIFVSTLLAIASAALTMEALMRRSPDKDGAGGGSQ